MWFFVVFFEIVNFGENRGFSHILGASRRLGRGRLVSWFSRSDIREFIYLFFIFCCNFCFASIISENWSKTMDRDSIRSYVVWWSKKTTFFHNYLKMWILVKIGYFQRKSDISRKFKFSRGFKKEMIFPENYGKNTVFLNCPLLAKRKI